MKVFSDKRKFSLILPKISRKKSYMKHIADEILKTSLDIKIQINPV